MRNREPTPVTSCGFAAPKESFGATRETGYTADFFDVDGFTEIAMTVLDDPEKHRHLGQAGAKLIEEGFSLEKMLNLYEQTIATAK